MTIVVLSAPCRYSSTGTELISAVMIMILDTHAMTGLYIQGNSTAYRTRCQNYMLAENPYMIYFNFPPDPPFLTKLRPR